MADFKPTDSQREAIGNRGGPLLVSAAAGSGKTRVLTERLTGYITAPGSACGVEDFLVITYTRAAAAELKSRIADALAELSAADPSAKRLRRQSALVQTARIGTIHSFCADLLREHCHAAGLPPSFSVADEDRARELSAMALRKTLEAAYQSPDADFLALADTVGAGRDDRRLEALLLTLHGKLQCHARPADWAGAWLEELSRPLSGDAGDTLWGRELLQNAADTAGYWAGEMDALLAFMARPEYDYIARAYGPAVGGMADALRALERDCAGGWDKARASSGIPFGHFKPLRSPADPEAVEFVKSRRGVCKKACEKLAADFAESSEKLLADMARTAPAMRALLRLTMDFDRRFAIEKRRRSLVDFSDLEHMTAQLLTEPDGGLTETAREVSRLFTEVMVDEYQDVSQVQDLIINAVSGGGKKLFMVGDVKQSIYRFRLADPGIFIDKYLSYKNAAEAAPGQPRRVLLRENFRSDPKVLDGANAVFRNLMSRRLGELSYDDDAALRPGLPPVEGVPTPELVALTMPDGDEDDQRPDKLALEAAWVAKRINALVTSGAMITDRGVRRPVGYGDVAILLRSANVCGGVYRRELAKAGVPVLSDQSGGFFRAPEITVLISLLAVIDNPRQDVALIAVLRSELFLFTADELSAVRAEERQGDFFSALLKRAETDAKCAAFLETLDSLRRFSADAQPAELLLRIYDRLGCLALARALPDGGARRENLMLLFDLARQFGAGGYLGLRRFLLTLRSMDARGQEPHAGAAEKGGAVRIMSIHKSKGLEFPVVFLCDTGRQFGMQDLRNAVLVHPTLGLGPKLIDVGRGIEYPTLARRAVAARMKRETLSEELRLLYVAMTRARELLTITCVMPDPLKTAADLRPAAVSPVPPNLLADMNCPAKWLMTAALADGGEHLRLTILPAGGADTGSQARPAPQADGESAAESADLEEKLSWRYPHQSAITLPSKITATELKGPGEADGESGSLLPPAKREFRMPELGAERPVTAAQRGTAAHLALRYLDLARTGSAREIRQELERLAAQGRLSEREAAAVDVSAIARLFSTDMGARIRAAKDPLREFPFTLLCRAGEFFPEGGDEELLLQGVVDLCFEEQGALTVVDYKTDAVTADQAPRRAERYRRQLQAYALAMERMTGKPVRQCALCFLRPGVVVEVEA